MPRLVATPVDTRTLPPLHMRCILRACDIICSVRLSTDPTNPPPKAAVSARQGTVESDALHHIQHRCVSAARRPKPETRAEPPVIRSRCRQHRLKNQCRAHLASACLVFTESRSLASLVLLPGPRLGFHRWERFDINSIVEICQVLSYPLILGHPAFVSYPVTITVQLFFISLWRGGPESHFLGP